MNILLDAMGGDNAPDANIKGALKAVNQIKATITLVGKEEVIRNKVKEFTGKVIAIIHRLNDMEDKWVAVPEDMTMTAQEIKEQVRFQEQYFETEIEMLE